jgi:molybdate transport system substrate-binding protein
LVKGTLRALAAGVAVAVLAAGCGGSSGNGGNDKASQPHGTVRVLYAGSLVDLMEHSLQPKFKTATGYTVNGEGKGSSDLAAEIKGKVTKADVFLSASPDTNSDLMGAANGDWVSWYVTFGSAPLVLGYNPKSKFAHDLKTKPWQKVITEPGFKLGRTDPVDDPKGKLAAQALQQVGLGKLAKGTAGVYPEETLVGRLQAGQLDAGFFYTSEATAAKIPNVSLAPVKLAATYTVTVVNHAPDAAGAAAFVKYLLSRKGSAALTAGGVKVQATPTLTGKRADVPASVRSVLPAS